jgi:hypothetical protein
VEVYVKVLVPALVLLFSAGLVPAKELSRTPVPPAAAAVGPVSSPETDPHILAIRAQQSEALARGDRAELKRLEGEVQAIYLLQQQPASLSSGLTVRRAAVQPALRRRDGADAVIDEGRFIATAADYTMDGNIYVAAFHTDDSTTRVYRSTDHGSSWVTLLAIAMSSPGGRLAIPRLGLCVGEGDSAFIHVFCVVPEPYQSLVLARVEMDGSDFTSYSVWTGSDTVTDMAVCRDYNGSDYWLYAVAVNGERLGARNAWYLRSTDYGKNWAVTDTGSSVVHPHNSFGAGSWLYHVLEGPDAYAKGEVRLFHNTMYGASGEWHGQTLQPDTFSVRDPVIAPAFALPESTAAVWTLFSHDYQGTGDWDMLYAWSTNGGRNWVDFGYLSSDLNVAERFADLRNYTSLGNTYMNGSYIWELDTERFVFRHYSNSPDPGNWSDTARINANAAGTGRAVRPLLVYSPGAPGTGAGCVFVGVGLYNLYFNSPWLTALAEAGSPQLEPGPRALLCRGALEWPGSSPARLFDAAGRPVARVLPGPNDLRLLPAGVYHVRTAPQAPVERLVLLR